ncbi:helix-turn-helix domain-containing protein [Staphylococcus auricularis]|uniref:HTH cro/C1-type domain-containing protein n=1 Tax=Staphylococcus auricularis TaxID=29379 RepID=A0ABX5IH69_9STAP|nr:helix-turn-helix domain-containing protein [Staphylococcus auricularis]MCE5037979.1 helix-turn-helix transcriptional regulator [Staphylococcus auricularis]MEB6569502.1 helix-turn-helix domain-containing protein [Staphylococcus auricularis]PTH19805.1 hypothetical protein BU607_00005 [Staphylococcus auricularis]PTH27730.1 hypothetical protein BU608_01635 [Staphylococcus auricularis]
MAKKSKNPRLSKILLNGRNKRELTLRQVAYKTGLSSTYISQLERGMRNTPDPYKLKSFADVYEIDYLYLMKEAGYLDKERVNDPYEILMFSDKEAFDNLDEAERYRILNTLRDQADYLIDRAKRNK